MIGELRRLSLAVLFSGSPYLLRIAGPGEAGYQRPVRATEGQDAGIADRVQAVASWKCYGLVLVQDLLVPSALVLCALLI